MPTSCYGVQRLFCGRLEITSSCKSTGSSVTVSGVEMESGLGASGNTNWVRGDTPTLDYRWRGKGTPPEHRYS